MPLEHMSKPLQTLLKKDQTAPSSFENGEFYSAIAGMQMPPIRR